MCSISVSRSSAQRSLDRKSSECDWSILVPPHPLHPSLGFEARDQFRVEESWCLAWGTLGHRFCHCSTAATPPPPLPHTPLLHSAAVLTLRASPLLPRLPNEEWHASGGSDLSRALASSVLSPIIDCGGSHWVAVMRPLYTREASLPNQKGWVGWLGGGGSKARCDCMDSWGPNCLYSWAVWLILGKNETL